MKKKYIITVLLMLLLTGFKIQLSAQFQDNQLIIGTWKSDNGGDWKLTFKNDGKCYENYGGTASTYLYTVSNSSPQCGHLVSVTVNTSYLQLINIENSDSTCFQIGFTEDHSHLSMAQFGFGKPTVFIKDDIVSYYNFDDLSDNSQYNNNLTLNEEAYLSDGKLVLYGGSPWDYLHPHATAANSPSLNPQYITVAARIKPEDFYGSGNDVIVHKPFTSHTPPYYQYHLGICGTYCGGGGHYFSLACSINGRSEGMYSPANAWIPGQWSTVVGTYDGSTMKLYVNGSLVASKTVSGSLDSYPTDLFIGKQGNIDYSIPAEIDWVKTYNRALSETEVQALNGQ